VRTGRRREFAAFGWDPETVPDPQDPATFDASKLDWDERSRDPHATTLAWYRDLIALRRSTPALMDADRAAVRVTHDHETGSLTVARGPVTLVANLGSAPVQAPLEGTVRLASPPGTVVRDGVVELPPDGAVVAERGR
jgi:maltooligosyltrehalose trehalohydrolase